MNQLPPLGITEIVTDDFQTGQCPRCLVYLQGPAWMWARHDTIVCKDDRPSITVT